MPRNKKRPDVKLAPEIFLEMYRRIKEAEKEKDLAAAGLRATREEAKAMGIDLNAIKIMEHLGKLDDREAEARMRNALQYSEMIGLPFATQQDLFQPIGEAMLTTQIVKQHADWKVEQDGYQAGLKGVPKDDCPHRAGTKNAQSWRRGWADGDEVRQTKGLGRPGKDDAGDDKPDGDGPDGTPPTPPRPSAPNGQPPTAH